MSYRKIKLRVYEFYYSINPDVIKVVKETVSDLLAVLTLVALVPIWALFSAVFG